MSNFTGNTLGEEVAISNARVMARAAVPADPAARARQAIDELRAARKVAVDNVTGAETALARAKDALDAIDKTLRDLGQVPVARGPRVKKVAP